MLQQGFVSVFMDITNIDSLGPYYVGHKHVDVKLSTHMSDAFSDICVNLRLY